MRLFVKKGKKLREGKIGAKMETTLIFSATLGCDKTLVECLCKHMHLLIRMI